MMGKLERGEASHKMRQHLLLFSARRLCWEPAVNGQDKLALARERNVQLLHRGWVHTAILGQGV